MKKKAGGKKFVTAVILLLVILAAGAAGIVMYLTRSGRFMRDSDVTVHEEMLETEKPLRAEDVYDLTDVRTVTEERRAGTYTLLVIGGDTPEKEEDIREDAQAVILMTINHNRGEVCFETLHTNMYVDIPGKEGHRLGNAYAVGGGPLLAETITENYGIPIDNYAAIDLRTVAGVLDMPEFETIDISTQGIDVVEELLYQLNAVSPLEIASYITSILPHVTHNIEQDVMMRIIMQIPRIVPYYSVKEMLPFEGLYQELEGYLVPDAGATAARLQEIIYGEEPVTEAATENI